MIISKTLVSSKYAVTAAHCLRVTPASNTALVVGEHNIKTGSDTNYTAVYLVKRFVEHPSYSNITSLNDIGLVETTNTILYSRAVAPVCLPFYYTSADFAGTVVTATGWGSTSFGGPSSDVLLKVNLDVLSNSNTKCTTSYPSIAASQMCTYTADKDTCQFDSGGPLFYRGPTDAKLFLVALVSAGDGCGSTSPALNSRATSFVSWIESVIGTGVLCRRALA
ncbi:Venom serine protease [Pseudolycoriella hygida]|uniref:Venom serine protease n=1 Tax=Pseudolycoriella hygida TaxID=35572 RepID=A0A9Q0N1T3_9DIPT|nr:Venom serine protease [Pseudolycoriella hygida]